MSKYRVVQWIDSLHGLHFYRAQKKIMGLFWFGIGPLRCFLYQAERDIEIHKNKVVYEE